MTSLQCLFFILTPHPGAVKMLSKYLLWAHCDMNTSGILYCTTLIIVLWIFSWLITAGFRATNLASWMRSRNKVGAKMPHYTYIPIHTYIHTYAYIHTCIHTQYVFLVASPENKRQKKRQTDLFACLSSSVCDSTCPKPMLIWSLSSVHKQYLEIRGL